MNNNWEIKKLEDVCEFFNGLWTGKKPPFVTVNVIRNTNFTKEGLVNDSDIAVLKVEKRQYEKRKLEYGDIILEKSGGGPKQPVGRVIIFDKKEGEFSFSNFTSVIRVKNKTLLDFRYLHQVLFHFYISGVTEKLQKHTTGIRNLDFTEYKALQIPLPPLSEQKRIVKILDEKFRAIEELKKMTEQQIKDLKELFESRSNEVFDAKDTECTTLNKISINLDSRRMPITKNFRKSGDTPYYGASGIVDYVEGHIFDENLLLISEDGANLLARTYPIAFSISGKTWVNNHAHVLKFENTLIQKFIEFYINSISVANFVTGAAQPKLNQGALNKIPVPKLSLDEQEQIVKELDALSKKTKELEAIFRRKIVDLEELKKSYLEQAFSGKL